MKKLVDFIFSAKMTVVLLFLFAAAIGSATFVEDKYDTVTAKILIYNSRWFELLLLLLAINFIGNIKKYNMFTWAKAPMLTFHLAFIVLIIGAGITRYIGFEGTMHIREGEASDQIYTNEPFLLVNSNGIEHSKAFNISSIPPPSLHWKFSDADNNSIDVVYDGFLKNAIDKVEENVPNGTDIIELAVAGQNGQESFFIKKGEIKDIGKITVSYDNDADKNAVNIYDKDAGFMVKSPYEIKRTSMDGIAYDDIHKDIPEDFRFRILYNVNSALFVFKKYYPNAVTTLVKGSDQDKGTDAIILDVNYNNSKQKIDVFGGTAYNAVYQNFDFKGKNLKLAYGDKPIELPFSLYLNAFMLTRYPGSMSPSSYESNVTLIDNRTNLKEEHRIYMNHVLNYDGYRFFQSSYDGDEKGTILSVNHDFWGTMVSYAGYILLALGFILTLLSKNSRFHYLTTKINEIRRLRKESVISAIAILLLLTGISFNVQSANTQSAEPQKAVSAGHADLLGHLVVQTYDGRFEPIYSLAFDVIHKISRKDKFDIPPKGPMNDMQVFLDMFLDMEFWKNQKIIYVRESSVRNILGITTSAASYSDFFTPDNKYKLAEYAETAFRKKAAAQNAFDKEVLKVDERVNICMEVFKGSMLRIFPLQNSMNNKWVTWYDSLASVPLTGPLKVINQDLHLEDFNYVNIQRLYFMELLKSVKSGDYTAPDKILNYISAIQRQSSSADILPSKSMINLEIYYDKANIFTNLINIYFTLSLCLLFLAFFDNFKKHKSKVITVLLNIFVGLLALTFAYHTYGMGLRWYLTGHAPWSNGYEALILIAWAGMLAGFIFSRYSKITLAATSLLAFAMLLVASFSSYDPQLSNLEPVLKSYWLIIHVACITTSYGFLGLGFFLGLINLFIFLFKTASNSSRLKLIIEELTCINEMNLSIGLFMATVGTFLGGVWASESWGRYWGWDAKETWALVIVITYSLILHLRLVPSFKNIWLFNVAAVFGFSSVLMTFIGVNYYLSKGLHSYAQGDTPVFPLWAWLMIFSVIILTFITGIKEKYAKPEVKPEIEPEVL